MYKILSIDGGGIRGVIPAFVLSRIEEATETPICNIFDMIAGTSTGGILALGCAIPANPGFNIPKFTARELLNLYEERGQDIFSRSFLRKLTSVWGICDEKYASVGIEAVLRDNFGDIYLSDALTEILITSYDIEERKPYFFKRSKALQNSERNHLMRSVGRATSAAPTYFEPAKVSSVCGNNTRHLIDGGVFANNPALCAYAEAISMNLQDNVLMVSLGTGLPQTKTVPFKHKKLRDAGKLAWIEPVLRIIMDGVADAVDYQLGKILPANQYFRFDVQLPADADGRLDAVSDSNIRALKRSAKQILADPRFNELCEILQ